LKSYHIVIIGGGASGLFLASLLGKNNYVLIERGGRLGKKLSSTGNGQGNITNAEISAEHYFTDDGEKLNKILSAFGKDELLGYLSSLGGMFSAGENGRIYPTSRQASSVTDLLIASVKGDVLLNTLVTDIKKSGGGYIISVEERSFEGEIKKYQIFADIVAVCAGGKAQKQFGTDGNFYPVLKSLGHSLTPLYPALVQIKTDIDDIKTLRGIRSFVRLKAASNGEILSSVLGDVIFTEYGISGNAAFFISSYLSDKKEGEIYIEFLPDIPAEDIIEAIRAKQKNGCREEELLSCIVNNQIGRRIIYRSDKTAEGIAAVLKKFTLNYRGTLGFDYAQVTRGGVPLKEVDEHMQSAFNKGLYICGEALNVDGECGGYNLQFAFSSAFAAFKGIKI